MVLRLRPAERARGGISRRKGRRNHLDPCRQDPPGSSHVRDDQARLPALGREGRRRLRPQRLERDSGQGHPARHHGQHRQGRRRPADHARRPRQHRGHELLPRRPLPRATRQDGRQRHVPWPHLQGLGHHLEGLPALLSLQQRADDVPPDDQRRPLPHQGMHRAGGQPDARVQQHEARA